MEISLQEHTIIIKASPKELKFKWVQAFIMLHSEHLLFLSRSVWVYNEPKLKEAKENFLRKACHYFAKQEQLNESFFVKAILCCVDFPIKISTYKTQTKKSKLPIALRTLNPNEVEINLDKHNPWYLLYIRSKLEDFITKEESKRVLINTQSLEAKQALQRALQRNRIFHYTLHYDYEEGFLRKLFESISHYEDEKQRYYMILGCSHKATLQELKHRYKTLAKNYHPDTVLHTQDPHKVLFYTQKFQELQEAYHALKGA